MRSSKRSIAELLSALPDSKRAEILKTLPRDQLERIQFEWKFWARPNQLEPEGDWRFWLVRAGRGFGKTRIGSEWTRKQAETGQARHIGLIAATAADVRDVLVEGPSGLLNVCPPWNRPLYEPSKRRLTWPNGAIATTFSADEPERLRGPQHDALWADEIAAWRFPEAWDLALMGLRLGKARAVITTTPRPTDLIRRIRKHSGTVETVGTSYENRSNLAPEFYNTIITAYEGTRLGRQELLAELLEDIEGALWKLADIDKARVREAPRLVRIVVAIDPATSSNARSDQTGIVVAGVSADRHGYVLQDASGRYSPDAWARKAIAAFDEWSADRVIGEVNNGGELIEHTLRTVRPNIPYKAVHASRGKQIRAEPIAALFEQHKVHHVGCLAALEDQLTNWVPGVTQGSPDRLDALVWALTELMLGGGQPAFDPRFMAEIAQANRELGGMAAVRAGEAADYGLGDDLTFSSYGSDPLTRKWSM